MWLNKRNKGELPYETYFIISFKYIEKIYQTLCSGKA